MPFYPSKKKPHNPRPLYNTLWGLVDTLMRSMPVGVHNADELERLSRIIDDLRYLRGLFWGRLLMEGVTGKEIADGTQTSRGRVKDEVQYASTRARVLGEVVTYREQDPFAGRSAYVVLGGMIETLTRLIVAQMSSKGVCRADDAPMLIKALEQAMLRRFALESEPDFRTVYEDLHWTRKLIDSTDIFALWKETEFSITELSRLLIRRFDVSFERTAYICALSTVLQTLRGERLWGPPPALKTHEHERTSTHPDRRSADRDTGAHDPRELGAVHPRG